MEQPLELSVCLPQSLYIHSVKCGAVSRRERVREFSHRERDSY